MAGKRILAVENNDLVLSFLEDGLTLAGYLVDTASNGREALEKIDHAAYDLIISDVRMPEVDGPGLCEQLAARDTDQRARLVFLASPDVLDDHRSFLDRAGVPVLMKPFELDDLHSVVGRVLGQTAEPLPL
jgi:DNA-binding response OmpR family regulator